MTDRPHVVFWARYAEPVLFPDVLAPIGGAEFKVAGFARALGDRGRFRVTVVIESGRPSGIDRSGIRIVTRPPDRHLRTPLLRPAAILRDRRDIHRILVSLTPDVLVESAAGPETLDVVLAGRRLGVPAVYWAASAGDFDGRSTRDLGWLRGRAFAWALERVDGIICQTRDQQEDLGTHHRAATRVIRNALAVEPAPLDPPGAEVVWVGKWHRWKSPGRFLDLARRHPGYRFRMLVTTGGRVPEQETIRRETASIANLEVVFDVPVDRVGAFLARSRVMVNTSNQEGFSNAVLQAAAMGLPTLALEIDTDGLFRDGALGAWAGGDPVRLSTLLEAYMEDPALWSVASRRCWEHAARSHDLEKEVLQLEEFLEFVIRRA